MAGILDRVRGWISGPAPRNATQPRDGGVIIRTAAELEQVLRAAGETFAGVSVTPATAMRVATVYACVRIISGAVATLPVDLKRRVSGDIREDASDHPLWTLLRRRPNRWQTPSQFRRMLQANTLLEGNGYANIVRSMDRVIELIPLQSHRVEVEQLDDLTLRYVYTTAKGQRREFKQHEILHLVGMTLNGVHGVSPITYARETLGLSIAQDRHGAATFKNGARISHVLSHPHKVGKEGLENLRASLDAFRAGGENEGKDLVLEEGMSINPMAMTSSDAQWIESRKLSRSDIAMFFGVPPHMIGDTEKSTSWGTGIEQQSQGFVAYTLEDHLTMWEEAIARSLFIPKTEDDLYVRFNRAALVRGDFKTRMEGHGLALQWGIRNPDEVRALEDLNPRPDGSGQKFYDPPNTPGGQNKGSGREPEKPA